MYYFAYGSNMNFKQMKHRCQCVRFIKRGYLKNYKFVYDGYSKLRKGAVANVIPEDGEKVWGGLFEIDEKCLNNLDRYEGYPAYYERKELEVLDEDGNKYPAWVYLRDPKKQGEPAEDYKNTILDGAKDCNLPEEYINKVLKR